MEGQEQADGPRCEHEFRPFVYLIRLTAFLLILAAIANKNRRSDRRS